MKRILDVIIMFLTIIVLTSGCSPHQRQDITLDVTIPESFTEKSEPGVPIQRWWEAIGDEELNALMNEVFQKNLDIATAFARYKQMQSMYRSTSSSRFPSFNVEGEGRREKTPGFFGDNDGYSYQYSLTAGYEVDLWNKHGALAQSAYLEKEATMEDILALYLSISARFVESYYVAIEQRAQMELTDKTIESYEDTLKRVERRYREGLVSALDVYQAQQNLSGARAQRAVYESALAVAEHSLAVFLGEYPGRSVSGDMVELPEMLTAFPAGLPSEMLTRRPDIRAALLRLKASDEQVAAAISERFPSLDLLGSYGKSSTAFSTGDIVGTFWNIIAQLTMPLFDGGNRRAEVDRTKAVFEENLAGYRKTVLTAFQEVEDALAMNRATEERLVWLKERVNATEASLRLSLERYMQGLSDYLPVLTAQTFHFDAQSRLIAAKRQLVSDRISLAKAIGGEWMKEETDKRMKRERKEDIDT